MDVQADEAGVLPDPSATAVVERVGTQGQGQGQGQLFRDAYPTYADTDRIPAVRRGAGRRGPARWLRVLVVVVALVVLAAGAALGLVRAGVIDKSGTGSPSTTQATTHHTTTPPTSSSKAALVTPVSTGSGTATYQVAVAAYAVTVTTTTERSWVSVSASGQKPAFEGILAASSSQKQVLIGPSQVDVGAGGTKVIVTSGHRTFTLTPASAPFTYQFTVKS